MAADFETTTKEDDCRVWAWCVCEVFKENRSFRYGNTIASFMEFISGVSTTYYFHNLKFDGSFIVDWLLRNGFEWSAKKKLSERQFTTLISDMGQWYSIEIRFDDGLSGLEKRVKILDSLKVIPMPIAAMPKAFGLEGYKLKIDYVAEREEGHELTTEEKEYIKEDTRILADALEFMHNNNMKKLTTGSNALDFFKKQMGKETFEKMFPPLTSVEDRDIRKSYKGGFTYLNPLYKNLEIDSGSVYDVNSMYPWAMKYCKLPYGKPVYYSGEYEKSDIYDLYVCCILCEFKLKPSRVPSIQIKNSFKYNETEYLTKSEGPVYLYLTSVDYELFLHNYDVDIIEYCGGYMFKSKIGIFADYIDYWYDVKDKSRVEGNKGMEKLAKLMLNSLYGKFGTNPKGRSKIPYLNTDKDKVCFTLGPEEERKAGYLPIATFITSYCRDKIIRSAEMCGERFIYADTDSLHIAGAEPITTIDIDQRRLGAFKLEETFTRGKFIRQKTYMELVGDELNVKCAGMPENVKRAVTFENFNEGAEFNGKLTPRVVPGGVILRETTFRIKKAPGVDKCIEI